jgi:hypothetical protein
MRKKEREATSIDGLLLSQKIAAPHLDSFCPGTRIKIPNPFFIIFCPE